MPTYQQSIPKVRASKERVTSYLLTDPLPAVLAFDSMLDDGVLRRPSVDKCDSIQCDTNTNEVEYLVNKGTGGCKKKEGRQSMANFIIPKVMTDLRKLTGKTYPQDMMTAPSSSANLIVLFHHF